MPIEAADFHTVVPAVTAILALPLRNRNLSHQLFPDLSSFRSVLCPSWVAEVCVPDQFTSTRIAAPSPPPITRPGRGIFDDGGTPLTTNVSVTCAIVSTSLSPANPQAMATYPMTVADKHRVTNFVIPDLAHLLTGLLSAPPRRLANQRDLAINHTTRRAKDESE